MKRDVQISLDQRHVPTVVDEIWTQLRTQILRGRLPPGTRLVELEIASQLGFSQGSVRDALQRLERDGLVERRGGRGAFLRDVSPESMRGILEIRMVGEAPAMPPTARTIPP